MMKGFSKFLMVLLFGSLGAAFCRASMWDQLKTIKDTSLNKVLNTPLSQTKVADGLKEALKVGIDNAVKLTGRADGFLKNQDIKIAMPQNLAALDKGLRMIGFSKQLDDFTVSMNRAAEAAAPGARDIFISTIAGMSINDAMGIFNGGSTAATNYLKSKSSAQLREAFTPMVAKTLGKYAVTQKYDALVTKYRTLPFAGKFPVPDVTSYVLDKTLEGLFTVLGQQEAKIRTDPAARVTALLKEVFK